MADILKGAAAAKALTEQLTERTAILRSKGTEPCLAIVRLGERDDDLAYERGAVNRCKKTGIRVKNVVMQADTTQDKLLAEIEKLNADTGVHGVLLLRPLPKTIDEQAICDKLSPHKDVDGITSGSAAALYAGGTGKKKAGQAGDIAEGSMRGFAPCTAEACIRLLKYYNIPIAGKHAVVIGRSQVIGKPVSMLLLNEDATVTICHSRTEGLAGICRSADILVVAAGRAGTVGREHVHQGQIIVDVGIHVDADGNMCGDVSFAETEPIVSAITPVPGGVGAMTTAILAAHVIEAAERSAGLVKTYSAS